MSNVLSIIVMKIIFIAYFYQLFMVYDKFDIYQNLTF